MILFGIFSLLICGNAAYAATSSTYISANDTSASGSNVNMSGYVSMFGHNNIISTEDLWVELYKDDSTWYSYDTRIGGQKLSPNVAASFAYSVVKYDYYVWLDPDGANHIGCVGYGEAVN